MDDNRFSDFVMPGGGGKDAADCRVKSVFSVKAVDKESRRITAVASREMIDRDGEIVSIAALKKAMKSYMTNPVILAGHSHRLEDGRSPVVGKVVDYRFEGKDLLITVEFADTPLALEYWALYSGKYQKAFSIGFRGLEAKEELFEGKRVRVFTAIELVEISVVAVPANPAALSKTFVQQKRLEREKRKILDDTDALVDLLDRFDNARYDADPVGEVPDDSPVWKEFSAAEKEVLVDFHKNDAAWGFDPDDDYFKSDDEAGGDLSGFEDGPTDDTEKSFSGVVDESGEDYGQFFV